MPTTQIEQKLTALQSWVTAGICFLVVFAVSVMGVMVWQTYRLTDSSSRLRAVATETHSALCALQLDIQQRHDAGEEYLRANPKGLVGDSGRILISAAQIRDSLANQESTLAALKSLNCE